MKPIHLLRRTAGVLSAALLAFFLTSCAGSAGSSGSGGGGSINHSVTLSWSPSPSNTIVGYNVYRGATSGSYSLLHSMNSGTTYTDSTVQSGQSYFYVVNAVDSSGAESAYSNPAEAVIP